MDDFVMEQVTELQLDRSDWQLVKFGDVAIQQKESVDRENTELTRYVKGEHMASEDLHLREWGELTDEYLGPAFIRKFEQGDILYGSRRTYLRKVAIAHFDGITSNTTFVIKANEARIDKRLLPFVMLSEGFAEHSIRNSKGSVNPYINWKDIADYEFLLPPKEQQAQLAELLWAMDEVIESHGKFKNKVVMAKKTFFRESVKNSSFINISELAEVSYGLGQPPEKDENGVAVIRATNIQRGKILNKDILKIKATAIPKGKKVSLIEGDIIVVRSGAYTGDVAMIPQEWEGAVAGYDLIVKPFREKVDSRFLAEYLLDDASQAYFKGESVRSAQPHLNSQQVLNTKIPNIDLAEQKNISKKLCCFETTLNNVEYKITTSKFLQKSLINQIF